MPAAPLCVTDEGTCAAIGPPSGGGARAGGAPERGGRRASAGPIARRRTGVAPRAPRYCFAVAAFFFSSSSDSICSDMMSLMLSWKPMLR